MNKILASIIAVFSLIAVIIQFDLMLDSRTVTVSETIIRFFSFFTILTNMLVACYFSYLTFTGFRKNNNALSQNAATLTAITVYITIVGLIYQIFLRHIWNPTGMQKVVDEMLHSVNPLLVIIYWYINRKNGTLKYRQIGRWLIYPLGYLLYILIRGHFSNFYPYPFLNVTDLGYRVVIINSIGMTFLFVLISLYLDKKAGKQINNQNTGHP